MGAKGTSSEPTAGRRVPHGVSRRARAVTLAERRPAASPEGIARAAAPAGAVGDVTVAAPVDLRATVEQILHRALMSRSLGTPADFVVSEAADQLVEVLDVEARSAP